MIVLNNMDHGRKIAEKAGYVLNTNGDTVISREEGGRLLGGVVYTNFTGYSVGMHVGSFAPNWISRDLLWMCFDYPFNQLGCAKVFGTVPSFNKKALEFDLKLGFTEVTRVPGVFLDGDLVIVAMRRSECRWLDIRPKQFERKEAA